MRALVQPQAGAQQPPSTHNAPMGTPAHSQRTLSRTAGAKSTTSSNNLTGGEIANCLSASEIDALLRPLLGHHFVAARTFYDVRTGRTSADTTRQEIFRQIAAHKFLVMPLHTRHHWATAVIETDGNNGMKVAVFDSAPSPITRRDFLQVFPRLHLPTPTIVCHAR